MSRIFLDVGAHTGETLAAVLDYEPRFDEIVCFEPSRACWGKLISQRNAHPNVSICFYGLWNQTCVRQVFGPGEAGASLWKKSDHRKYQETEVCQFRRASDWFRDLPGGDEVFLKLNCEGAECDILDDLLDHGEFVKVTHCMIDFDVRKIESQKHREAEIRKRLEPYGFPRVAYSKDVMKGDTHQDRIRNWLRMVERA